MCAGNDEKTGDCETPARRQNDEMGRYSSNKEGIAVNLSESSFGATLPAEDIERAMRWYEEKLGLTPVMDLGVSGQLYMTGGTRWLIYQTPSAGNRHQTPRGWVVPDNDGEG